eukprot:358262-Chlamydomonas_euryale.AAC.11
MHGHATHGAQSHAPCPTAPTRANPMCWRKTPYLGAPTSSYMWTSPDQALKPGGEFCVPTRSSCLLQLQWSKYLLPHVAALLFNHLTHPWVIPETVSRCSKLPPSPLHV